MADKINDIATQRTLESTMDVFAMTNGSLKQIMRHYKPTDADLTNTKLHAIDAKIDALIQLADANTISEQQKTDLKALRTQREIIRRDHYVEYLISQNLDLGNAFKELKTKKFNTNELSASAQCAIMK
jgi:hypothetical protein